MDQLAQAKCQIWDAYDLGLEALSCEAPSNDTLYVPK